MKKTLKFILIAIFFSMSTIVSAQNIDQLKNIDIDELSDSQIATYWEGIKKKGYTLDQLETAAILQGVTSAQFAKFKSRVQNLPVNINQDNDDTKKDIDLNTDPVEKFGLTGEKNEEVPEQNLLFGYDFFNNPNISFTPNINIATPQNYQLGPGDELVIDLWGAAEISYQAKVTNQGAIKIEGVGQVYVNGLTLEVATQKINSYLKRKHAGIGASKSSFNKIFTDVTLSKTRTVQVNIIGEVKVPGTYSLVALSTVLNALYAAGGPTKNGTFRDIKLIRNGTAIAKFDMYQYLLKGSEIGNIKLRDQDVILVSPYQNHINIEGEVKRPGVFELLDGETLKDLISYFGGFTSMAYTDLLVVERVNGKEKEVREVQVKNASDFKIQAGDKIIVQKIIDKYSNRVVLVGEVSRPGDYELLEGMSLKELLHKADGVTTESFMNRGLLVRTYDDTNKENISFSVSDVLRGKTTIKLQAKDKIRIFSKEELKEKQFITIQGAVKNPQQFDFVNNLKIEDVIAMAGGINEGGDRNTINVSRRLSDGSFKTLSQNFNVFSSDQLTLSSESNFVLMPFDIITVRYLKGYTAQKSVSITGEVNFQGTYELSNKNERISDLVKRAGGLTEFAYVKGATLLRRIKGKNDKKQLELLKDINEKDSISNMEEIEEIKEFKVGINLEKILSKEGIQTGIDLFLEEGDELLVPTLKQTVEVQGEVLSPSLVRFSRGKSIKSYISSSGGFSSEAKKSKIFVLYSNGDIKSVQNYVLFKVYPKIEPGAVIFVPSKKESKNRLTTQEILGITTSLGTLGLLIQSLSK